MMMDLPPALLEVAQRELNETPEARSAGLQALRSKVEERGGAGSFTFPVDDETLLSYLRPCKFDVEKAWKKLVHMDAFFRDNKQHAEGTDVAKLREWYSQGFIRILRGRSKAGAVVNLFYPARMKPFDDPYIMVKWNLWVMPKMLKDTDLQVNGMLILEDFEDFSLWNMMVMQRNVPRDLMKKNMHFLQDCSPMRLKGIYIINQPMYMSFLWAMARPFMSAKLRSRIHFLGKNYKEQLDAVVDPTVLPPDLGGTLQEDPMAWFDELVAAHPDGTAAGPEEQQQAAASAAALAAAEATS